MSVIAREIRLARRPTCLPVREDFAFAERRPNAPSAFINIFSGADIGKTPVTPAGA